jgi:mono/diheme cytochrome c family protein
LKRQTQRNHFAALAVAGLCAVLPAAFVAHSQQSTTPTLAQQASETFQARCSTCHAEHGEGSEAGASLNVPDLRSAVVQKTDDSQLRQIIKRGRGNMPAFGRDFSDQEIDRILQLIRTFTSATSQEAQSRSSSR